MKIDSDTLYEVYKTTEHNHDPDLVFGLARLRVKRPDITQEQDRAMREFMGRYGSELARAYPDREKFAAVVEKGVLTDEERTRCAAEAMI